MVDSCMYIVTHKPIDSRIKKDGYLYIAVGKRIDDYLFDGDGNNISNLNRNFCELTALYWIWKNSTMQNVGLCHYRRFFVEKKENVYELISIERLNEILKNYDLVVPYAHKMPCRYDYFYEMCLKNDALKKVCDYLISKNSEYKIIIRRLLKGKKNHCYNMFYCKKELIDRYSEWLFDILLNLKDKIDISNWSVQQQRVYGYLSEFLFNVWIYYNDLKTFEVCVSNSEVFPAELDTYACDLKINTKLKKIKWFIKTLFWPIIRIFIVKKVKIK